jgi:solute carrier family 25 carnitine/acylcarnitine transporter 20/29
MSADFWAGYISGAAGIIIGNPLDLIKVRLQAGGSVAPTVPSSYTSQFSGFGSLVRGATAPILGYGALNALLFVTYNRCTAFLNGSSPTPATPASLSTIWTAGAIGGLATWVVSTPTELVKCRAQMSNSESSLKIAKDIFRSEGVRGLYFGGIVTALRDSIGYGFYFWSYEWSTRLLASKDGIAGSASEEAAKVLLCGGLAGVVTWASIFPLDVIKTRVQTQAFHSPEYNPLLVSENQPSPIARQPRLGAVEMARTTYRSEGAKVFFRGLMVCSVRAFMVNAAQWAVYEWCMKAFSPSGHASVKYVDHVA